MFLISFIIPLHPISLLHTTQCTYTTRTDSILGLSSVRVRINVNGVSKPKRVTNHMRILVQWWCMRICACSGFLLSGGSGGCFDGILADRTNLKMCTFCMNIMMNIVGHHFQNIILHIYLRTCTVFHPRSRLTSVLSIGDDALWFLCALIPGFKSRIQDPYATTTLC